jgi:hypothetical protein
MPRERPLRLLGCPSADSLLAAPIAACEIDVDTNALKKMGNVCCSKVNMLLTGVNAYG